MKLFLFGFLALYVLDFLKTSTTYGSIIMPGNSTDEVVLVGYSSEWKQENVSCVKSKFTARDGEWVNRTLEFKLKYENTNQEEKYNIRIKVWKYRDVLELGKESWLKRWTNGSNEYLIRYYDNRSLVLSTFIQKIWVHEPCSFWVKTQYLNSISQLANETFTKLCRNATFVGYDVNACRDQFAG
uniref:Putative group viii salivary lipocalin n=1 Tax=Rhipicephalus pulchellus TaxID=72859 RepID=L7MA16_RHIPC